MAVLLSLHPICHKPVNVNYHPQTPNFCLSKSIAKKKIRLGFPSSDKKGRVLFSLVNAFGQDPTENTPQDKEEDDVGVKAALSVLRFYKREISPLLPKSCRYVPTCSEYSMQAYKKYGVSKGTVLTACRICRCNPLGGSGYDPPRWFDEPPPPEE